MFSIREKIKGLFAKPFITKAQLKELLINARLNERSRVENEWSEKYQYDMDRKDRERESALIGKDSEIAILNKEIAEYKAHIKTIEAVYEANWNQIKLNASLAAELRIYVNKAQNVQSDIYKNIQKIVDKAEEYHSGMTDKDPNYRRLLKRD